MADKDLAGRVVVLTGAATGIGRENAALLAQHGARMVLADNDEQTLPPPADELGALAVPCDVADYAQVCRLAERAARHFGRIDAWVNNAGVTVYGSVEELQMTEIRRVIEVNLFGSLHGMKAALPYLRDTGGVIINVTSILGKRSVPLQAAYCAAKHGVVAFSESLRMELRHAGIPVRVVDLRPSGINTPLFEHARSKLGVHPRPTPPVYEPSAVAEPVLDAIRHPVRDVVVGGPGRLFEYGQRFSPALLDQLMLGPGGLFDTQRTDQADDGRDNLDRPMPGPARSTGLFGRRARSKSWYTKVLGMHPHLGRLLVGAGAVAVLVAARAAGRRT